MQEHIILGIDIGGSGIKGGLVNTKTGEMITERYRLDTPQPATPKAVAATFKAVVDHFKWQGPIGVGFPAIVRRGVALSAANIDKRWINTNIEKLLRETVGCPVFALNDADAAGIAAMQYGAGKGVEGTVIILTIGTGIGSAVFVDGELVPNTEFGHMYMGNQKKVVEKYISGGARKSRGLSWSEWGDEFDQYLHYLDRLLSPDMVIIGGGGSKRFDNYKDKLTVEFQVQPAAYLNKAGAVGAAYYAWRKTTR